MRKFRCLFFVKPLQSAPQLSDISPRALLVRARLATTAVFVVQGMGMGAWAGSIPAFRNVLHLNDSALSLSLLAYASGGLIGMPTAARLVCRLGSQSATLYLALFCNLSIVLPGFAPSLSVLIGAAFIAGLGKGFVDIAMNSFAVSIQFAWGGQIMSFFHAASSSGGLIDALGIGLMFANGYSVLTGLALLTVLSLLIVVASVVLLKGISVDAKAGRGNLLLLPCPRRRCSASARCVFWCSSLKAASPIGRGSI